MKHFFKYQYGFINIDEDNIYFSKTGNWKEAARLVLQDATSDTPLPARLTTAKTLAIVIGFIGLSLLIYALAQKRILFGLAGVSSLVFGTIYLKQYLTVNFFTPIEKLKSIRIDGTDVHWIILQNDTEVEHLSPKVSKKGLLVLFELYKDKLNG